MPSGRSASFSFLCALPFVAIALAGARPLHDVPGHASIGIGLFCVALAAIWRLGEWVKAPADSPARSLGLAAVLLLAPWLLILLLWTGLGAPFQASALENQHRFTVLLVNALLVGAGFMVLRDALQDAGERFLSRALFAAAVPASGLYLACIAITLAQATMAAQGDHTPVPPLLSHMYDTLEFFACVLTYLSTALAAAAMHRAGLLGAVCARIFFGLCIVALVLLVMRGIEYPEISGQTAPWYTQPGVIVRIPAIPWLMPGLLAAVLLRKSDRTASGPVVAN